MICPTCHQEIPDNYHERIPRLFCPRCTAAKSYNSILDFERQFLPRIIKGEVPVTLAKTFERSVWHVLFTGFRQAWCGELPDRGWKKKKRLLYPEIDQTTALCARCHAVVERLAENLSAEVTDAALPPHSR